jgi:hypothetical protein
VQQAGAAELATQEADEELRELAVEEQKTLHAQVSWSWTHSIHACLGAACSLHTPCAADAYAVQHAC